MNLLKNDRQSFQLIILYILLICSDLAQAALSDTFQDNTPLPHWQIIEDNGSQLGISESNQHVEIISTGASSPIDDALFLSNGPAGFTLSTNADFKFEIELTLLAFNSVGGFGDSLAFVLGVGEDLDGQNSAAIGFALGNTGLGTSMNFVSSFRVSDTPTVSNLLEVADPWSASSLKMMVEYDQSLDHLTLIVPELAISDTLNGLVLGQWNASELMVSFGARGSGFALASGDAVFDNFNILFGNIIPEPATISLIGLGAFVMVRRRTVC